MGAPWLTSVVLCMAAMWAASASACQPSEKPTGWFDKRISVSKDGSFENAEDNFYQTITGAAVLDIGGGKIGQRIRLDHFCGYGEKLLVVDCTAAKLIVIQGRVNPDQLDDFGGGPSYSVTMLYPPQGKVRLSPKTTIDILVNLSKSEGYEFETDPEVAFGGGKKKNRYNAFGGCQLFYPDSLAATQ